MQWAKEERGKVDCTLYCMLETCRDRGGETSEWRRVTSHSDALVGAGEGTWAEKQWFVKYCTVLPLLGAGIGQRTDGLESKRMPRISNVSCREANGPGHGSAAVAAMRRVSPTLPMPMILRPTKIGRHKTSSQISGERALSGRWCQGRRRTFLYLKGEAPMMEYVYDRGKGVWGGLRHGALELRCLVMTA